VLDGVDLTVPAGSTWAVVGPSGAGKTTLLRAIAGLSPVSGGVVHLGERDITRLAAGHRHTGMVFQEDRLFPSQSVLDNVAYGLRARGVRRHARRGAARELLDAVGLGDRAEDRPQRLSGGQRQRVALARALCSQPDLLLLDEPLSAVDGPARGELRALLRSLQVSRPTTTIVVTHDLADATTLGDAIAVLLDGRIAQCAPPAILLAEPASVEVAALTGNPNRWPVQVRAGCADLGGWAVPVTGPDGAATITVRPERLRIAAGPGVLARVQVVEQRGSDVRLVAQSLAGPLEVRHPGAACTAPQPGDEVRLAADPTDVWRFPATATPDDALELSPAATVLSPVTALNTAVPAVSAPTAPVVPAPTAAGALSRPSRCRG
jgi:ABC-type sulfate/molybdate transport systems ATPase subunit